MSLEIFSVSIVAVLMVTSLAGSSMVAAHYRALVCSLQSQASDPITGEWNWTGYDNGRTMPATFKLKLEGTTVTGRTYKEKTGEGVIRDGKFSDGKLSFTIDFQRHTPLVVHGIVKDGKLEGDSHHPDRLL